MSNFTFALPNKLTGDTKSGGGSNKPFPKLGHAYVGEITTIGENSYGFIEIGIASDEVDLEHHKCISFKSTQSNVIEIIDGISNNLIASNESMKGAIGQDSVNILKWADKGLKIGFRFEIQQENDGNGNWVDTKWLKISPFTMTVEQAKEWEPREEWNDAHRAKFWSEGGTPAQASTPTPAAGIPVGDELPF